MAIDGEYAPAPPARRFPVMLAVVRSYELTFARVSAFARSALVWAALCLLGLGVNFFLTFGGFSFSDAMIYFMPVLVALVFLLTSAGAAHAWHRVVLREQWAKAPLLEFSGLLRYLGVLCALVFGVILLPTMVINIVVARTAMDLATIAVIVAAVVGAFMSAGRLSMTLPAAAIGERLSFVGAWRATEDNSLRFLGGAFLIVVPSIIASWIIEGVVENFLPRDEDWAFGAIRIALKILLWFFGVGLTTTYLSLAYRFFVQKRDRLESGDLDSLREAFR